MGDFNDVPEGDLDFAPRARKYPKKFNLINALNTRSLDVFRTIHPSLHGHSFQRKKRKKKTEEVTEAESEPEEKGHEAEVEGDEDSRPSPPPPSVDEEHEQILPLAAASDKEETGVEGDEDSCPPSPTPSINEEQGEAELVVASSAEEEETLSSPSRIDSLWVPRSWKKNTGIGGLTGLSRPKSTGVELHGPLSCHRGSLI
jgi:hypothetical protein